MDKNKFEKLLAELDTMDFDDLGGDDFHGTTVNDERWIVYQRITTALLDVVDKNDHILKVHYLSKPNPEEEFASVMVVMSQMIGLDKEVKAAFAQAATLCDSIAMTAIDNKIRISFAVDNIWKDGGENTDG